MASFTDQILQSRPYVQQLPLEAMAQVGMYKQQKYEEGVQKIQSYIDNIAGMDIMHDSDKQYLQSKLNELGSKLKTVAAADFSNFQLVNSVGGMATQITKDPNIQNALFSTANYRKNRERIQKDIDEGKSNPANIDRFDKYANSWLGTKKVGQKFSASYDPYFDFDKFARETFNAIKPDGYTFEQIYETDGAGRILIDPKTKKPVFSPVMVRLEQEGLFPKTVKATLDQIFSDPRVSKQLQITGEFNYKNYSGDNLKALATDMVGKKLSIYETQLAELNIKKGLGQNVQDDIDKLTARIEKAKLSESNLLEMADSDPDALRGILYKDDVYDNFTTMYGTIKEKRTTEENPGWNQMFKQQQEVNDNKRHAETMALGWARLKQDDLHHKENVRINLLKLASDQKKDTSPPNIIDIPADISLISMEEQTFSTAAEKFNDATKELIIQSGALAPQINKEIQNSGGKLTPQQALTRIADSNSKKLGMNPTEYTQWLYNKGIQEMAKVGDANLSPTQRAAKLSAQNAQVIFKKASDIRTVIDKQVGPNPTIDLTKNLRTETFSLQGGKKLQLNPQDQYDIAIAFAGSDWYESPEVKAEAKAAQERLRKKGINQTVADEIISQYRNYRQATTSGGKFARPSAMQNSNVLRSITGLIEAVDKRENVDKTKQRAEIIKQFYQVNPILEKNLITGDSKIDNSRAAYIQTLVGTYARAGQQESPGFMDNVSVMSGILAGKEKGTYSLVATKDEVSGQITPKVVFVREDGSFGGEMTVTQQEAASMGQMVNDWWQPDQVRQAQIALDATGNGTTSHSGNVNDPQTYINGDVFYTKSQFRNLKGIADDVKGNISAQPYMDENGQVSMLYYGHIFVNGSDGTIYKPRALPPTTSMADAINQLLSLTPQMIQQYKIEGKNKK